jgi:hypothetical protein
MDLSKSDITEARQDLVVTALSDIEDIQRDAAGWPDADEIAACAGDAVSAINSLNDAINHWLEAHPCP